MKPNRFLIVTVAVIVLALGLYAAVLRLAAPKPTWFSDEIIFTTKPGISPERVIDIVMALHGASLQFPGFPPDNPNWVMGVPWVKNERDTDRVVQQLLAYPDIQRAEVSGIAGQF